MVNQLYPRVEINTGYLTENVSRVVKLAAENGVSVAGVIKGATGLPGIAKAFADGGVKYIASSRLEQLEDAKESGIDLPALLLRIPMLTEVPEVIRICDITLVSELTVMRALNEEAKKQSKTLKVIVMADLGDLREGFWDKDEMVDVCAAIENEMDNLFLYGIGTNLGCYGSIEPTPEKLDELVAIAEKVEAKIGRTLDVISGGATSSIPRFLFNDMPKRINMLRIGEGILLARDLDLFYGYDMSWLHQDVFTLKAEVIEVKDKPTYPVGIIAVDAFGHKPVYTDRGIRKRALIGIGKVDYGSIDEIFPHDKGVTIIGASSDHTILDIEDAERDFKVGDIVSFTVNYASLVYVTNTRNVRIEYI